MICSQPPRYPEPGLSGHRDDHQRVLCHEHAHLAQQVGLMNSWQSSVVVGFLGFPFLVRVGSLRSGKEAAVGT